MTTNQLQFQRNAIEAENVAETQRKNKAQEALKGRELGIKADELDQKEREALAKYGLVSYAQKGVDTKGGSYYATENAAPDFVNKWIEPWTNIFRSLSGGKK